MAGDEEAVAEVVTAQAVQLERERQLRLFETMAKKCDQGSAAPTAVLSFFSSSAATVRLF